jgi:hypothetical protein
MTLSSISASVPVGAEICATWAGVLQMVTGSVCPGRPGGGVLDPGPIQSGTGISFYNV